MSVSTLSFGVNRPTISCIFDCKLCVEVSTGVIRVGHPYVPGRVGYRIRCVCGGCGELSLYALFVGQCCMWVRAWCMCQCRA